MALHLVRSLGQAFDVCHKLNPRPKKKRTVLEDEKKKEEKKEKKENSENAGSKEELTTEEVSPSTDTLVPPPNTAQDNVSPEGVITDIELPPLISLDPLEPFTLAPAITPMVVGLSGLPNERPRPRPQNTIQENPMISSNDSIKPMSGGSLVDIDGNDKQASWEMERQQLKTQLTLLTDQLHAETAARIETQARVEHLLMQNKGLLAHLQKLMIQLQQLQSLQMSQLSSANKTPDKDKKRSAPVTDLTPPNTDMSEPSSSEVHLVNDTSSPHQSDDQPLLEDISVPSADSPPQSLPLNGSKEDDIIAAAFTPQLESNESESSLVDPFVPRGSNDPDPFASHESSSSKVDPDPFTPQESSNKVDPDPFTPQESSNKVDPDPFRPQDIEIIQLSVNENEGKFTDAFSPQDDQTNLLDAFKPQELHDQPPLESTYTVSVIS
jgi:carboxyl-terminal PDZ ligand of neuronal nitric oxide synthase protein